MKLKTFSVVHFPTDNSYEVVPSSWISEDQISAYFPSNKPKGFQTLQSSSDGVADSSWPTWEISIIKSYGKKISFCPHLKICKALNQTK